MSRAHLIQKLVFELNTNSREGELGWEKHAETCHRKYIQPAVEECFQQYDSDGRHLIIDRLEIDLGVFASDTFTGELKERLVRHLQNRLREFDSTSGKQTGEDGTAKISIIPETTSADIPRDPVSLIRDETQAGVETFLEFLRCGRFPWWFAGEHFKSDRDIQELFPEKWIRSLSGTQKERIKQILLNRPEARIRFSSIHHFNAGWLAVVLEELGMPGSEAGKLWTFFESHYREMSWILPVLHQHYWQAWIRPAEKIRYPNLKQVFRDTAAGNTSLYQTLIETVQHAISPEGTDRFGESGPIYNMLTDLLQKSPPHTPEVPGQRSRKSNPEDATGRFDNDSFEDEKDVVESPVDENLRTMVEEITQKNEVPGREENAPFFVEAAGMVLLHPFLPELFLRLHLRDEETGWRNSGAPFRAVRLLSFLSHGRESLPENRVFLHKYLAGIGPDTPLPAQTALREDETDACNELLQAVIRHWKALRNTTPDGLRDAFLRREGKLMLSGESHRLQIEQKTEDILLSRLPWGYSLIRLPWMSSILHVTWI